MNKVLKFEAEWCGPCKILSGMIEAVATKTMIEKVDVDKNPELTKQYNIRGIPTMVKLDAAGLEIARVSGTLNANKLNEFLNG